MAVLGKLQLGLDFPAESVQLHGYILSDCSIYSLGRETTMVEYDVFPTQVHPPAPITDPNLVSVTQRHNSKPGHIVAINTSSFHNFFSHFLPSYI